MEDPPRRPPRAGERPLNPALFDAVTQSVAWDDDWSGEALIVGDLHEVTAETAAQPLSYAHDLEGPEESTGMLLYADEQSVAQISPEARPWLVQLPAGETLSPYEEFLVQQVDGQRTIRELMEAGLLAPREIKASVLALVERGVLSLEPRMALVPAPVDEAGLPVVATQALFEDLVIESAIESAAAVPDTDDLLSPPTEGDDAPPETSDVPYSGLDGEGELEGSFLPDDESELPEAEAELMEAEPAEGLAAGLTSAAAVAPPEPEPEPEPIALDPSALVAVEPTPLPMLDTPPPPPSYTAAVTPPSPPPAARATSKVAIPTAPRRPLNAQESKAEKLFEAAQADHEAGRHVSALMNIKLAIAFNRAEERYHKAFERFSRAAGPGGEAGGQAKVSEAAKALFEEGCDLESSGDIDGAIRCFERALENAKDPAVMNRLGVILAVRKGYYNKAQRLLQQAVQLEPRNETYQKNLEKVLSAAARGDKPAGAAKGKEPAPSGLLGRAASALRFRK